MKPLFLVLLLAVSLQGHPNWGHGAELIVAGTPTVGHSKVTISSRITNMTNASVHYCHSIAIAMMICVPMVQRMTVYVSFIADIAESGAQV